MRKFTTSSSSGPVLATVVSLTSSCSTALDRLLPVLQYPRTQNAVVTVTTVYVGADPRFVAGFIYAPLENSIAQANGIDYMELGQPPERQHDHDRPAVDYEVDKRSPRSNTKVQRCREPAAAGVAAAVLTVTVARDRRDVHRLRERRSSTQQITDYLIRVVQPKLQAVEGVQSADILGGSSSRCAPGSTRTSSQRTTSRGGCQQRARREHFLSAVGRPRGRWCRVNLTPLPTCALVARVQNRVIKQQGARCQAQRRRQGDASAQRTTILKSASTARGRLYRHQRSRLRRTCSMS